MRHGSRMDPSLTSILCTQCGLCCDGSLFADVELASRAEATSLEIMGLVVDDDDANVALLPQPCAALRGRRCGIYAQRPKCCRTFECRLLQDVRRGAVSLEGALEQVAEASRQIGRTKQLMVQLGQRDRRLALEELCAEALSREGASEPDVDRVRAELAVAMSGLQKLIRKTFLGRGEAAPRDIGSSTG